MLVGAMLRTAMVGVVAIASGAVLAACGDGQRAAHPHGAATPAALASPRPPATLDDVYANMLAAISRPGAVLHVVMQQTYVGEAAAMVPAGGSIQTELWIDAARGVARRRDDVRLDERHETHEEVIHTGDRFGSDEERSYARQAFMCRNSASALLSALMACRNALEETETQIEHPGTTSDPLVLVSEGTLRDSDATWPFTARLSVDRATWLPSRLEEHMEQPWGTDMGSLDIVHTYAYEFVPSDSVDAHFFEPTSVGYTERDPAEGLAKDVGMQVLWLGREFDVPGDLPKLVLRRAGANVSTFPPGYRATLDYAPSDDRFGPPVVSMQEWRREDWDDWLSTASGGNWWDDPSVTSESIDLPGGRMTLFHGQEGSGASTFDRYLAHVYLGETLVMVMDSPSPSPYNTRDVIIAVTRGLTPYELGE